jgi:uncharacterized protein (DUF1778 family)
MLLTHCENYIVSSMARTARKKPHPLSMRLRQSDIAVIDRAADLRGRSRTDFVREAALRAAEDVLLEAALIRLSPRGFESFQAAIAAPPNAIPEMVALFKRKAPWVASGQDD